MAYLLSGAAGRVLTFTGTVQPPSQRMVTPASFLSAFTVDGGKGKATMIMLLLMLTMVMVNGDDDDDDAGHHLELGFRFLRDEGGVVRDWIVFFAAKPVFYRGLRANATGGGDDHDCSFGPLWDNKGEWPAYLIKVRHPSSSINEGETAMSFHFKVPGGGKKDFKVSVKDHELRVINLKKKQSEADEGENAGLLMSLLVWPYWFKSNLITVDFKLGVLTVVVPFADGKCSMKAGWLSSFWPLAERTIDRLTTRLDL